MLFNLLFRYFGNKTNKPMKKAIQITGKILYFIIALSPIFALGYMLGMKL